MWVSLRTGTDTIDTRPLETGDFVVGRDDDCDLVIDDERASRRHARLRVRTDGVVEVEDVGSTNGTFVNGIKVTGPTSVRSGDEIRVGRHVLRLTQDATPKGRATVIAGSETAGPSAPNYPPATPPWAPTGPEVAPPAGAGAAAGAASPWGLPATAEPAPRARVRFRRGLLAGAGTGVVIVAVVAVLLATQLGGSSTLSAQQLGAKWGPSTLYIQTDIGGQTQASGTAWVYNAKEGLIVTNAHVVNTGTAFMAGQGPNSQPAQLVGVSVCDDLAVLKVSNTNGLRSLNLGSQQSVHLGEPVTALGYPGSASPTPNLSVTTGVVSVAQTSTTDELGAEAPRYTDVIQTSAAINPGNSGGPLLDNRGRLVGVNTATSTESGGETIQNEGYAIGVDRVRTVVTQLAQGRSLGYTGMKFLFPAGPADFKSFHLPVVQGGLIVEASDPDSPAFNAISSQIDDAPFVVTAVDGQPLDGTLSSYCHVVGSLQSGQDATFHVVLTGGSQANVRVPFE